jgi:uncharacterized membrane protein
MQGIYTYIPETNNVPREYIVAAILLLLFMVPISLVPALALLCFYVSTFRSMWAVPSMAVFYSSLTSWFPGMLLMYFLNIIIIIIIIIIGYCQTWQRQNLLTISTLYERLFTYADLRWNIKTTAMKSAM